jgi:DNA-binding IclR family transcriptional regulator
VGELASATGLNRSTAWRLLATLDHHGLVERDPATQRYSVGHAVLQIAAAGDHDALVRRARPVLQRLAQRTGETANLAVAKRFNLVYVDQVEAPNVMSPNWLGRSVPLHATSSGKAFLAWLPREEREALTPVRIKRYTETTITSRRDLEEELEAVRRDGYSICAGELE